LGRLTTSVAASEKAGLVRFPAAAHVIAPVTDLRTLFRSIVPCLSGPIAHLAWPSVYLVCAWRSRSGWGVRRAKAGGSSGCKSHRQPLQPEPIGAVIEVTVADQPGRVQYSTTMRRIR